MKKEKAKNKIGVDIKQLSCLCGVSTATVSLVLNNKSRGRVSEGRRQQILRAAEEYGYRPQHAAKGLAEGRNYRIGLVIQGTLSDHAVIGELSFYYRFGLMAKMLSRHGYAIELVQTGIKQSAENMVRILNRLAIDGLLFLCWPSELVVSIMKRLDEKGIPSVVCGSSLPLNTCSWTDVDRFAAVRKAAVRLIKQGYSEIALLDCSTNNLYSGIKQDAFLTTVHDCLGRDGRKWIFDSIGGYSYEQAVELTRRALAVMNDVRAIILTDNYLADVILNTLRQSGLSPGQDCRVIGIGDTSLADKCSPRLSHYDLQIKEQAEFSVNTLLKAIDSPSQHPCTRLFKPKYLARET